MAATDISGFDGAVTLPSGHGGEVFAWTMNVPVRKKDVSRYGGSRFVKKRGGIYEPAGTVSVFLRANAASTAPGAFASAVDGEALTLTAAAGCTFVGSAIIDFSMSHSFGDPAIEGTYNWEGTGDWAETWDVT
jgi:hypothetical protein